MVAIAQTLTEASVSVFCFFFFFVNSESVPKRKIQSQNFKNANLFGGFNQ
jgi:hypothetical protein